MNSSLFTYLFFQWFFHQVFPINFSYQYNIFVFRMYLSLCKPCLWNFTLKHIQSMAMACCFSFVGNQAPLCWGNPGWWPRKPLPSLSSYTLSAQPPAAQLQQPCSPHLPWEPPRRRAAAIQRPPTLPFTKPQPWCPRAIPLPSATNKTRTWRVSPAHRLRFGPRTVRSCAKTCEATYPNGHLLWTWRT